MEIENYPMSPPETTEKVQGGIALRELKYDPIEDTEAYKAVVEEVNKKARKKADEVIQKLVDECDDDSMKDFICCVPTSHIIASEKKKILKEEYGIEWKSHIEMNPEIIFD